MPLSGKVLSVSSGEVYGQIPRPAGDSPTGSWARPLLARWIGFPFPHELQFVLIFPCTSLRGSLPFGAIVFKRRQDAAVMSFGFLKLLVFIYERIGKRSWLAVARR